MNWINKILISLVGEDKQIFEQQSPISKKKILSQASLLLIPTILWFIIGYCISCVYFNTSIISSFLVGFLCSVIVFIVDRAILLSEAKNGMKWFRVVLAFMMAFLGGELFNLFIFENDIAQFQLEQEVTDLRRDYKISKDIYIKEMNGDGSKNGPGNGPIAKEKKKLMTDLNNKLSKKENQLDQLKSEGDNLYTERALLDDTESLFALFRAKPFSLVLFIVFFFIHLSLELIVVLNKIFSPKSSYEKAQSVYEQLKHQELENLQSKVINQLSQTDQEKRSLLLINNIPQILN